jgi:hypothetical protein
LGVRGELGFKSLSGAGLNLGFDEVRVYGSSRIRGLV